MRRVCRGLPSVHHTIDCALAIGNFDGVHRGHQALLEVVVQAARARGLQPAVLTFEPHPREVLGLEPLARICTLRDKVQAIMDCGIERVYILPFHQHLAQLTPAQFARDVLVEGLACRWVCVGENFTFGAGGAGHFDTLEELGRHYGFETYCAPLMFHGAARISSSRIRAALRLGDIVDVNEMLGRPLSLTGRVIHGAKLGRELGFPTLNMALVPAHSAAQCALHGVWAVQVYGLRNTSIPLPGVACVGYKPTVTQARKWLLETHVLDWSGNAYGRLVRVRFCAKIRDEKTFDGLAALQAAIARDEQDARRLLGHQVA